MGYVTSSDELTAPSTTFWAWSYPRALTPCRAIWEDRRRFCCVELFLGNRRFPFCDFVVLAERMIGMQINRTIQSIQFIIISSFIFIFWTSSFIFCETAFQSPWVSTVSCINISSMRSVQSPGHPSSLSVTKSEVKAGFE